MLTVATLLWEPNRNSLHFSRVYDELWVDKLYSGFRRNLTVPFRFVCFTDRERVFQKGVEQELITAAVPDYSTCIEPYRLGEPMILVGLDTVITGNCDHFAKYCLQTWPSNVIGLPRDPYFPDRACNGVALVPGGKQRIYTSHRGENDMEWMRRWPHQYLDDVFPGQILSYKVHMRDKGRDEIGDARIIYFHGLPKMNQCENLPWIRQHWRI